MLSPKSRFIFGNQKARRAADGARRDHDVYAGASAGKRDCSFGSFFFFFSMLVLARRCYVFRE